MRITSAYRAAVATGGLCVGCGAPAFSMPLCNDCAQVWSHDGDTWDDQSTDAQAIRDKANVWRRAHGDRRV